MRPSLRLAPGQHEATSGLYFRGFNVWPSSEQASAVLEIFATFLDAAAFAVLGSDQASSIGTVALESDVDIGRFMR